MNMPRHHQQAGFTLIELVVSITVSAIVVGFIALFLVMPVQAYLAQSRRATLTHEAGISMLNLGNDLRSALPNSVRYSQSGSTLAIELWPVIDVASYRDSGSMGSALHELEFTSADSQFSNYASFTKLGYRFDSTSHRLVINNTGQPGSNVYEQTNVITPAGTRIWIDNSSTGTFTPPLPANEDHVTLVGSSFKFANPSPTHHVYLVATPVTYICDPTNHTLTRYANYAVNSNLSTAIPGGTSALISNDMAACSISCVPGTAQCSKVISLNMIWSQTDENLNVDSLNVMQQIALDYQP